MVLVGRDGGHCIYVYCFHLRKEALDTSTPLPAGNIALLRNIK